MQYPVNGHGLFPVGNPFLHGFCGVRDLHGVNVCHARDPPQMGQVEVAGHGAEPDPDIAVPSEAGQGFQRLEEHLLRQLLRQTFVMADGP